AQRGVRRPAAARRGQWPGVRGRADGFVGTGRGGGGVGTAVDGAVRGAARRASATHRVDRPGRGLRRRGLAQRGQQPDRLARRPGGTAGGGHRLGLRLGLEPRTRPAAAVHDRRRADAVRRRGDAGGRARDRGALRRLADGARHVRDRLPGHVRFAGRLQRLRLAAAPRAPGAGRQLRLRQSGDRGAAGRVAGRRALRGARPGRDGGGALGRGRDQPGQDAQAGRHARGRGRRVMNPDALDRRGLWIAVAAFVIWGLMPLYWPLLQAVPSLQIVLHRPARCAVLVAAWLTLRNGLGRLWPRACPLLKAVPSLQSVLHRAVWCAVLVAAWLTLRNGRGWLRAVLAQPRLAGMLALSGALIAFNWGLYVWAVNDGHVVEASLGYFINPLLNVLIGVVFLRE